jgi:hypothetical protein
VAVFRGASIQRQDYFTTDKHGLTWSSGAATKRKRELTQRRRDAEKRRGLILRCTG